MNENSNYTAQYQLDVQTELNAYIVRVFGIMFAGLAITATTAFYFAASGIAYALGYGVYFIMLIELLLVVAITAGINKLSYGATLGIFILYSFLNGITLSFIFLVYEIGAIGTAFAVTAATFGAMSLYGRFTKTDLTSFGSLARMLLIGGIIVMLVNLFMKSQTIDFFVSAVLLFVFVGLVAYDTQKLKRLFYTTQNDQLLQRKIGVTGALSLYLDFVNIFLSLLRLFGRGRK